MIKVWERLWSLLKETSVDYWQETTSVKVNSQCGVMVT